MGRKQNRVAWLENDGVYQDRKVVDFNEDDYPLDEDTSDVLGLSTSLYRGESESSNDWFERVFDEL